MSCKDRINCSGLWTYVRFVLHFFIGKSNLSAKRSKNTPWTSEHAVPSSDYLWKKSSKVYIVPALDSPEQQEVFERSQRAQWQECYWGCIPTHGNMSRKTNPNQMPKYPWNESGPSLNFPLYSIPLPTMTGNETVWYRCVIKHEKDICMWVSSVATLGYGSRQGVRSVTTWTLRSPKRPCSMVCGGMLSGNLPPIAGCPLTHQHPFFTQHGGL